MTSERETTFAAPRPPDLPIERPPASFRIVHLLVPGVVGARSIHDLFKAWHHEAQDGPGRRVDA